MLTRSHVELIEIPQRMGASRKNAADIKMSVDALELAFERDYVTTFVLCTGDSDFTPLVHKLRELNKRVIGVGIRGSTSDLLPPSCDEFLFYDSLEGVETRDPQSCRAPAAAGATGGGGCHHRRPGAQYRRPERPGDPNALRSAAVHRRGGALLVAEAGHPPQGPDLLGGGLRVPQLRRAAPPSGAT